MFESINIPKILKCALKNGGDFADLYAESTEQTQIISEENKIDRINSGIDSGIGLRVIQNANTAYGFTNDVSEKSLLELAEAVSAAVRGERFDKEIGLTPLNHPLHFFIKRPPHKSPLFEKAAHVNKAAEAAWKSSKEIKQVRVIYQDAVKNIWIANSIGEYTQDKRTYITFQVHVIAGDGKILQTGYRSIGGFVGLELLEKNPPEGVAIKSAEQAVAMLKARKAPGGTMPVVLSSEAGGTMIHEAVGHGLEADLATEGFSLYQGQIGNTIASTKVTVIDDSTIPQRRGSFTFDDEGVPSQKTILIENGVLKSFMHNRMTARKNKVQSTGNGRRESYRFKPIVRMTNTLIAPGKSDSESIIHSTEKGIFVKMMGGGQVNAVNGDFVFEVSEAYLIEKGKIGDPIRGATLTGNGPRVLKIIDKVGNDLGFGIGTCGKENQGVPVSDAQPTIRIPELIVGGSA